MSRTTTKIIIAQKDGTVVGQYFLGLGEHLIGREDRCTIQLEADQVSREHANLIISADAIEIVDLGSTSGTYLDGVTVKGRIPVQPGQQLWISDLYIDIERQGFGGLIEGSRQGDGRFTLKRELGKGGMGAVWLALDEETQENFAIKLISGEISLDPKSLKDLQREVNKAHKLVHPNIVRTGYFWKEEGGRRTRLYQSGIRGWNRSPSTPFSIIRWPVGMERCADLHVAVVRRAGICARPEGRPSRYQALQLHDR